MTTTSKAAQYINYITYSDVSPYEVIEMSPSGKTAKVRAMSCTRTNQEDDVVTPGGFCCHVSHPTGQQWDCKSKEDGTIFTMTLRKDGGWQFKGQKTSARGLVGRLSESPRKFYDMNF
jgi:hypothetical protein